MAAEGERTDTDVLRLLRTGTAAEHEAVERSLDLLDPGLDRLRLVEVLGRLHGFWRGAGAGPAGGGAGGGGGGAAPPGRRRPPPTPRRSPGHAVVVPRSSRPTSGCSAPRR